jgi:hypothetical protein
MFKFESFSRKTREQPVEDQAGKSEKEAVEREDREKSKLASEVLQELTREDYEKSRKYRGFQTEKNLDNISGAEEENFLETLKKAADLLKESKVKAKEELENHPDQYQANNADIYLDIELRGTKDGIEVRPAFKGVERNGKKLQEISNTSFSLIKKSGDKPAEWSEKEQKEMEFWASTVARGVSMISKKTGIMKNPDRVAILHPGSEALFEKTSGYEKLKKAA